jgi:hypothetical protein
VSDGTLSWQEPQAVADVAGGMLCDEPGMGKTITVLSLVLKTLRRPRSSHQELLRTRDTANLPASPGDVRSSTGKTLRSVARLARSPCMGHQELLASDATLIIVPATLVEHWEYQIRTHTKPGLLTVCAVSRPSEMPQPDVLASAHVVITTFDVLSKEWSVGRPAMGTDGWYKMHGVPGRGSLKWRYSPHKAEDAAPAEGVEDRVSALLRVAWRRIVLDEGHVMGASSDSNKALMCAGTCPRIRAGGASLSLTHSSMCMHSYVPMLGHSPDASFSTTLEHMHIYTHVYMQQSRSSSIGPPQPFAQRGIRIQTHVYVRMRMNIHTHTFAGIYAESRWICTGTPTPSTPASELMHLYGLLSYLNVSPFSSDNIWRKAVVAPFEVSGVKTTYNLIGCLRHDALQTAFFHKDFIFRMIHWPLDCILKCAYVHA